jgi:hypothetical protein
VIADVVTLAEARETATPPATGSRVPTGTSPAADFPRRRRQDVAVASGAGADRLSFRQIQLDGTRWPVTR